jgi:hypothetical protein
LIRPPYDSFQIIVPNRPLPHPLDTPHRCLSSDETEDAKSYLEVSASVTFTSAEIAELNAAVAATDVKGARPPDAVLVFTGVEAPARG